MHRLLISLITVFSLCGVIFAADIYIPKQTNGKVVTHEVEMNEKPEQLRSMVSQKNLLGLERSKPYGLPEKKHGKPITAGVQDIDSLHILVLRIEFETEDPDDESTTGDGNFDLRTYDEFVAEEGHEFDPAPHNKSYFNSHMEALRRYWRFVSDGQLRLTWEIYPEAEDEAYRLPHPMSYYGSDVPSSELVSQLLNFTRDAIQMVDTVTEEIDFSEYQSIFLFHAGSNQQNNIDFIEDTPNDFWTGFLWTEDTVFVDNSSVPITEVLILPETCSQDNRVTVINSVVAHEFGHQLGLVDVYNTNTSLTQVGNFSLMDNNCQNIALELDTVGTFTMGVLPSYPDAWSRAYLGFSGVTEVVSGDDIVIRAAEQDHFDNEIIKVPISEYEYFLIENRQTKADFEYTRYSEVVTDNAILGDPETSVILGPGWAYYGNNELNKIACGEYDRLLPGDGLLIWHIDELVAYLDYYGSGYNNFKMNSLQWDYNRRFIRLIEADGIVDFGGNYYAGYGDAEDYFYDYNATEFTPSTLPSTESNLGANTHISITDIKSPYTIDQYDDIITKYSDTVMYCDVEIDWYQAGFPTMGFPDVSTDGGGILAIDIDSDGVDEMMTARGQFILALNGDASPVMDTTSGLILENFDTDTLLYIIPYFAYLSAEINGELLGGDFDGDSNYEIACVDANDTLYIFTGNDVSPQDSSADLLASVYLTDSPTTNLLAYDIDNDDRDEVIFGVSDSVFAVVNYADDPTLDVDFYTMDINTVLDITHILLANDTLYAAAGESGTDTPDYDVYKIVLSDSTAEVVGSFNLGTGELTGMVCGDIDRDSVCDVVAAIGNRLAIYYGSGEEDLETYTVPNPSAPVIGDIDADGYPDIVVTGVDDESLYLYAFNHLGNLKNNFPVMVSAICLTPCVNEPLITDMDDDGYPDIIVTLPDGALGWDMTIEETVDDEVVTRDTTFALPTGGLSCYNYHGDRLGGFPLSTSTVINIEPAIGNFDSDAAYEIAAIDSAGFFSVWDLETTPDSIDTPWSQAGGGINRAGYLSPSYEKPISIQEAFLDAAMVYNYPNPAGDETNFRYYVDRAADINIKIFDMTGELVDELTGETSGRVDDEITWDCSAYASGVYYARFEAVADDASESVMIKVALIK